MMQLNGAQRSTIVPALQEDFVHPTRYSSPGGKKDINQGTIYEVETAPNQSHVPGLAVGSPLRRPTLLNKENPEYVSFSGAFHFSSFTHVSRYPTGPIKS